MEGSTRTQAGVLLVLLVCALGIRGWHFPDRYEVRDGDEVGYVSDGLLLWEGITPGFKASPSGPITWTGWMWAGTLSVRYLFAPEEGDSHVPRLVRPFVAVDQALFRLYSDLSSLRLLVVVVGILVSLGGVAAGFLVGYARAGVCGGLMTGGLVCAVPLFVSFSLMARPYGMAWSFAFMAFYFAALHSGWKRSVGAAVFMALSIASRVEMVAFLPILLWEFWYRREGGKLLRQMAGVLLMTFALTLLISPWLITGLLGNLRTIATVRFSGANVEGHWIGIFLTAAWKEGLGPTLAVVAAGLALCPSEARPRQWVLGGLVLLLLMSMSGSTHETLRHHGVALVALVCVVPLALQNLGRLWPHAVLPCVCLSLALPLIQIPAQAGRDRMFYAPDRATDWIEQHVRPGSVVYLAPSLRDPLPTPEAADRLWDQVASSGAWKLKFARGLERYQIESTDIPRALSEENMVLNRALRRRWFILGGGADAKRPRFDVRIRSSVPPFDITPDRLVGEFKKTGGVVIVRGEPFPELGEPAQEWTNGGGRGTFLYCSPEALLGPRN